MPTTYVTFTSFDALEDAFKEVATSWGLSPSEREAVQGTSFPSGSGRRRRSRFVSDRMVLVVEIDWLLGARMEQREIRMWLRRRVAGVFGSSPIEAMFGSTDRLRRIRTLLALEVSQ